MDILVRYTRLFYKLNIFIVSFTDFYTGLHQKFERIVICCFLKVSRIETFFLIKKDYFFLFFYTQQSHYSVYRFYRVIKSLNILPFSIFIKHLEMAQNFHMLCNIFSLYVIVCYYILDTTLSCSQFHFRKNNCLCMIFYKE